MNNTVKRKAQNPKVVMNATMRRYMNATMNATTMRRDVLARILDQNGKDIDTSCGYPKSISSEDYHEMYSREGIAARVVDVWPEETWTSQLEVYENEDPGNETEFEKLWNQLNEDHHILNLLARADRLSGVGRFGVILIGIDDGKPLESPIEGVPEMVGAELKSSGGTRKLLYLRAFEESAVTIPSFETNPASPRFACPMFYNIQMSNGSGDHMFSAKVHWTRILHIADNREMSDVFGTPRMQRNYNRLLDLRKILGGSGEMFWRGGFPGLSFEVNDNDGEPMELDKESLRAEMEAYANGMQRYMALTGVTAKSLSTSISSPSAHLQAQLDAIAMSLGIPKRILFGSESAELASSQDSRTWLRRLGKRQKDYVVPMLVRPFIDRLIYVGVLPAVSEYKAEFEDLNSLTDQERAANAERWAGAFSKFVGGNVAQLIPPDEFLSLFAGMSPDEIEQINKALEQWEKELELEEPDEDEMDMENPQEGVDEPQVGTDKGKLPNVVPAQSKVGA